MTLAIDFDGTIVENKYPKIGEPMLFAFETLRELAKERHNLILWTYRAGAELDEAVAYCRKNGVEFYAVNKSFPDEKFDEQTTSRKILADIYIDDRSIGGFLGWSKIWQLLHPDSNNPMDMVIDKDAHNNYKKKGFFAKIFG